MNINDGELYHKKEEVAYCPFQWMSCDKQNIE